MQLPQLGTFKTIRGTNTYSTASKYHWHSKIPCRDGNGRAEQFCTFMHPETRGLGKSFPKATRAPRNSADNCQIFSNSQFDEDMRTIGNRRPSYQYGQLDRKARSSTKQPDEFPQPSQQWRNCHWHSQATNDVIGVNSCRDQQNANLRLFGNLGDIVRRNAQ